MQLDEIKKNYCLAGKRMSVRWLMCVTVCPDQDVCETDFDVLQEDNATRSYTHSFMWFSNCSD